MLLKFILTRKEDFVIGVKAGDRHAHGSMRLWSSVYFME